ncbi:DNA-directed RNA polymerase subunit beta [Solibacillus sp. MA9]|uniref:DNA-directed RNA polymerase subunit beta n=1 Tax=Solibacillus palustris TaxID=2908203 RepID=A0ABS9U8B4_9BACL|nr:DNA-directed RNA polymerase subunit beta [Solibacillus sp. MA9]MCH7320583.1 DNA-directed RNA polymerase subunit beta [Solibacillus sp. MA9]
MTDEFEQQAAQPTIKKTRRGFRRKQETPQPEPTNDQPVRWVQLRLIPIWLRIILVAVLFVAAAGIGLTIGYSVIGDGDSADTLKWSTWQHLLDIMSGKQ